MASTEANAAARAPMQQTERGGVEPTGAGVAPTPMMQRYLEIKAHHPHDLLLFRMGDFYELFYEDAVIAARVLGLTLTSRDKGAPNPIPMAGFPYHALNTYLQRLVKAGYRAAICEQMEDPRQAKGLVRREVTQVVTPGTLIDDALLEPRSLNYLACVYLPNTERAGLAWLDLSSGHFWAMDLSPQSLPEELSRIQPAECLVAEGGEHHPLFTTLAFPLTPRSPRSFNFDTCLLKLLQHFGVASLDGYDAHDLREGVVAAGVLLDYVRETQRAELQHITSLQVYRVQDRLVLDEVTRRNLEITETLRQRHREGSLLSVLDQTMTAMGSRLLHEWVSSPLIQPRMIAQRLDAVEEFVRAQGLRSELRLLLREAYDLQRLTARLAAGRSTPRDLVCLSKTLALIPKIKARLTARQAARLQQLEQKLELCSQVRELIDCAIIEEPPPSYTEGGVIRDGYHPQLDEWRNLARGGKEWIAQYQAEEIRRTGIPTLKVGYNKVFGYYLECTSTHRDKIPSDYVRKQTLKNQERFITPALKEYEDKVLRAESQAVQLEQELFLQIRQQVAQFAPRLRENAEILAELDVYAALAELAVQGNYCRPHLCEEPVLEIYQGRHPVLERLQPSGCFVPNDILLGVPSTRYPSGQKRPHPQRIQIITGPNMAGKSTYIRQAALITLMAHIGSFVPASHARIGITDRIFARVGASDELTRGQSTFMVEMTETARILHAATPRSLVILDEIGRGTSTYDGISLAWAITEYLHDVVGCRALFATHYHELTALPQSLPGASNWNVAVEEDSGRVVFLHRIVPGAADKSYGIHVAQLAGLPAAVIDRAKIILNQLEMDHLDDEGRIRIPARRTRRTQRRQLSLFAPPEDPVVEELRQLRLHEMTPEIALRELQRLQRQAQSSMEHPTDSLTES